MVVPNAPTQNRSAYSKRQMKWLRCGKYVVFKQSYKLTMFENSESYNGYYFGHHFIVKELVLHILSFADVETIAICRLVCKQWNFLITDPYFWKQKCLSEKKNWPNIAIKHSVPWTFFASIYLNQPFGRNLIKNPCGRGALYFS